MKNHLFIAILCGCTLLSPTDVVAESLSAPSTNIPNPVTSTTPPSGTMRPGETPAIRDSVAPLRNAPSAQSPAIPPASANRMNFSRIDTDKDGRISENELRTGNAGTDFKTIDTNHDGYIVNNELDSYGQKKP